MSKILKDSENVLQSQELDRTQADLIFYQGRFADLRQRVSQASSDKGGLLRRKIELETEISLAESDAIMSIQGDGKDTYVIIDGQKVPMTNDTARKAYMQSVAQTERRELAAIEGEIAKIDADRFRLQDEISVLQQEMSAVQSKATLQSALLSYMAREVRHVNEVKVENPTLEIKHVFKSEELSPERLTELLTSEAKLRALEGAGVDNWEGYSDAIDMLSEEDAD